MTAETGNVDDRARRRLLGLLFGAQCLSAAAAALVPVFGPVLAQAFGIGTAELGALFAALSIGGVLSVPLASLWGDRVGHRRVLRAGLLATALPCLACAAAPGFAAWAVALAAMGLAGATLFPATAAITLHLFPEVKRRIFTLNLVVYALAGMLWPGVAQAVLALGAGGGTPGQVRAIRLAFALLGVGFALLAVPLSGRRFPAFAAPRRQASQSAAAAPPVKAAAFAFILVLVALHTLADGAVYNWMPTLLDRFGQAGGGGRPAWCAPGLVLSGYSAAYLVGRLSLSLLPERSGRGTLLVVPGLLGGGLLITGLALGRPETVVLGFWLGALLFSLEYPNVVALGGDLLGGRWGTLVGTTSVVGTVTGSLGPLAVGWLARDHDLRPVLMVAASPFVIFGLAGAAWCLLRRDPATSPGGAQSQVQTGLCPGPRRGHGVPPDPRPPHNS